MTTRLRLVVAAVRAWTHMYTWRLSPRTAEARRAEIESDLWESVADTRSESAAAIEIVGRLLRGIPDDLRWRTERAGGASRAVRIAIALSITTVLLAVVWAGLTASPGKTPAPPVAPDIRWWVRHPPAPPPPPPPPPPF
jgi:hypothetical protein